MSFDLPTPRHTKLVHFIAVSALFRDGQVVALGPCVCQPDSGQGTAMFDPQVVGYSPAAVDAGRGLN